MTIFLKAPGTVAPLNGTIERYRVQAALNFVASEIHTSIGLRFRGFPPGSATYEYAEQLIAKKLTYLNEIELKDKKFLVGDKFSIADSYLYIVLSWLPPEDREKYPAIQAYFEGIKSLEGVIAAHARIATNPATAV
jgi:glutathione S-transferase